MDAEEVDLEEARQETREEKSELTNLKWQSKRFLWMSFICKLLIYIVVNQRYTARMLWVKIKFCVNLFYLGWCVSYFNNICVVALVIHEWVLPPNVIPVFLKSAFM